jgi:hypothetical protein
VNTFPARLHVLLAREAPLGVVIRRGPAGSACTLLWNRETDDFQLGQWLRARLYERRCDLSPDGKYLIYFAMNGQWQSEAKGAWTAISRAPYLKAVTLLAKGDCWHGGGLFTGARTYWLNDGPGHEVVRDSPEVTRDTEYQPSGGRGGECLSVYSPRLLRDGWTYLGRTGTGRWHDTDHFEKRLPAGWVIHKLAHGQPFPPPGRGCYWDEHELHHRDLPEPIRCPDWEWAEVDGTRLVWAAGGRLMAGRLTDAGLCDECVLRDFNDMTFEPVEAPY